MAPGGASSAGTLDLQTAAARYLGKPSDALGKPLLAGGKAPAHESSPSGPKALPGARPSLRVVHELLAEIEAVADALDTEECIHRAGGQRGLDARHAAERERELIAGLRKRDSVCATVGSPCSMATTPARCTKTGEHEVLYSISLPRSAISAGGATIHPRRHPVISHALEKLLVLTDAVVRGGDVEKRRRAARGFAPA